MLIDPGSIVTLLAGGAIAKLDGLGGEVVSDAYKGLKRSSSTSIISPRRRCWRRSRATRTRARPPRRASRRRPRPTRKSSPA